MEDCFGNFPGVLLLTCEITGWEAIHKGLPALRSEGKLPKMTLGKYNETGSDVECYRGQNPEAD